MREIWSRRRTGSTWVTPGGSPWAAIDSQRAQAVPFSVIQRGHDMLAREVLLENLAEALPAVTRRATPARPPTSRVHHRPSGMGRPPRRRRQRVAPPLLHHAHALIGGPPPAHTPAFESRGRNTRDQRPDATALNLHGAWILATVFRRRAGAASGPDPPSRCQDWSRN
jgi:hypothetical protein